MLRVGQLVSGRVSGADCASFASSVGNHMEEAKGAGIVVRFDGTKCIHSRHCVLDAPEVFLANVQGA